MRLLASVSILGFLLYVEGFLLLRHPNTSIYEKTRDCIYTEDDVGEPLLLTPLLEEGDFSKAQRLSKVTPNILRNTPSFSGYFTVNKTCGSNLFFWFFPAQHHWKKAPLVLWLQGGPGGSSLFGLFDELGPLNVKKRGVQKSRFSWNIKNNLLFIDQPVGTGFSFTENEECYAKNKEDITRDLFSAVIQFYQLFPTLRENKFYIAGESFAGHYIPALGSAIHNNNEDAEVTINLSGMMIGNGLMDAKYQSDYGSYLYQLGLIDDSEKNDFRRTKNELAKQIDIEEWLVSFNTFGSFDLNRQGHVSVYKFTNNFEDPSNLNEPWMTFVCSRDIRIALHVGSQSYSVLNDKVYDELKEYVVQSVKPQVEELLEHYPIVFYNGQLDIICAYPMAVNFLRHLDWSGAQDYLDTHRQQWCVDGQLAGYFRSAGNLHEVMVRNAGHMVPQDQPHWAFLLANSVTSSPPDNPLRQLHVCGK